MEIPVSNAPLAIDLDHQQINIERLRKRLQQHSRAHSGAMASERGKGRADKQKIGFTCGHACHFAHNDIVPGNNGQKPTRIATRVLPRSSTSLRQATRRFGHTTPAKNSSRDVPIALQQNSPDTQEHLRHSANHRRPSHSQDHR